jgi:hypothetical protein
MASNDKSIAGSAKILGADILNVFKGKVGDAWDDFMEKDKKAVERAAKRFAALSFKKLKGEDVDEDIAIITATLSNWSYVSSSRVHRAFWESAHEVVGVAASFLTNIISQQIPGA